MSETQTEAGVTPQEPETPPDESPVTPEPATPETPAEPLSEPDDDEAAEEAEQEAPEQPSSLTPKEIEAIHKRLDKEAERHAAKVGDILAEQAQGLITCPMCIPNVPGFKHPGAFLDGQVEAIKAELGEPVEPEYEKANNARTCDGCKGLGKRLSGSLVPDQRVLLCPECDGRGWVGIGGPQNGSQAQAPTVATTPAPQVAPEDKPAQDPWGRTPDDVDYGRLPNYVRA